MSTAASAEPRAAAAATLLTPVGRSNTDAVTALEGWGRRLEPVVPPPAPLVAGPDDVDTLDPGWFVDPLDAGAMRWWDGATWTDHTHAFAPPAAPAAVDPAPASTRPALPAPALPPPALPPPVIAAPAAVVAAMAVDVAPSASASRRVDRRIRPVYLTACFWLLVLAAVALWLVAWRSASTDDVPQAPAISVVPAPVTSEADEAPALDDPLPVPTLTPQPLG